MRIPGIDPPLVALKTLRSSPDTWIDHVIMKHHDRRSYTLRKNVYNIGFEEFPGYDALDKAFKAIQKGAHTAIVLRWVLNWYKDLEARRRVIERALDLVRVDGLVVAVARACDNGIELAEKMVTSGTEPDKIGISNLQNTDIGPLRPAEAVFLTAHETYTPAKGQEESIKNLLVFARDIRKSSVEPQILFSPTKITTRTVTVGFRWENDPKLQK